MPIQRESTRTRRTRDNVVQTAVELLVEGGVAALTVEAVVQRSGVARSTIYRHWPNRTEMVAAAFTALLPPLTPPSDDIQTGDIRQQLEALLVPLAEQIATERFAALVPSLLAGAATDPELKPFHQIFVARQREPLSALLNAAVDRGELALVDTGEAVSSLVGPLLFHRVILDEPVTQEHARRLVAQFLVLHRR